MSVHEHQRVVAAYMRRASRSIGRYSYSSDGYLFEAQERERLVLKALRKERMLPLAGRRILDLGCGNGRWLRDLVRWGADPALLAGTELRKDAVRRARELVAPATPVCCGDAINLPFPDTSFDIVIQSLVMSSVLDPALRRRIAAEIVRVLRPGGLVLWYDFAVNNPRNADVRGVSRREIRALFQGCRLRLRRAIPPPQLLRLAAPLSWGAAYLLCRLRALGASHVGTIRRPALA